MRFWRIALLATHPHRLLDAGTGTGCLLLTLLTEYPAATGLGVDASSEALDLARRNAARLGLETRSRFAQGNWCEGLDETLNGTFEILVSNPPYIPQGEAPRLMADVRDFEPASALFAGPDGLDDFHRLLPQLFRHACRTGCAGGGGVRPRPDRSGKAEIGCAGRA